MSLSFTMNHFSAASAMIGSHLFGDSQGKAPKRNTSVSSLWITSVGTVASFVAYLGWKYITTKPAPSPIRSHQRTCRGCQATVSQSDKYCASCGTAATTAGRSIDTNSGHYHPTADDSATSSCVYCHALLLANNEDACTECGKPVPRHVLFDGPSLAPLSPSSESSESDSVTRQQEVLPSIPTRANSSVVHERIINQVPPVATIPQHEYQQPPPHVQFLAAPSPTMVTAETMDDQHIQLVHAVASVPLVHAIAVNSTVVPLDPSDYNTMDNHSSESVSYHRRRSRNSIQMHPYHTSLVQQHAPLMNELREVIESLRRPSSPSPNHTTGRGITSKQQQDVNSVPSFSGDNNNNNNNNNRRASRVLAVYQSNTTAGAHTTATTTNRRNPGSPYWNRRPATATTHAPAIGWQRQKKEWRQTRRQRHSHQHCPRNSTSTSNNSNNTNTDSHCRNSNARKDSDRAS